MRNFENALVSRKSYPSDDGGMVVEEKWDINHPDCPFAVMNRDLADTHIVRHAVMSKIEFAERHPPNK